MSTYVRTLLLALLIIAGTTGCSRVNYLMDANQQLSERVRVLEAQLAESKAEVQRAKTNLSDIDSIRKELEASKAEVSTLRETAERQREQLKQQQESLMLQNEKYNTLVAEGRAYIDKLNAQLAAQEQMIAGQQQKGVQVQEQVKQPPVLQHPKLSGPKEAGTVRRRPGFYY